MIEFTSCLPLKKKDPKSYKKIIRGELTIPNSVTITPLLGSNFRAKVTRLLKYACFTGNFSRKMEIVVQILAIILPFEKSGLNLFLKF